MVSDFNEGKDLSNKRFLTLDNGNKLYIERTDPYGFWEVHYDKGQVPERLRGKYTSFDRAMVDVQAYLATKEKQKPVKATKQNAA